MSNPPTPNLLSLLNIVVLERLDHGDFRVLGEAPGWFKRLCPDAFSKPEGRSSLAGKLAFLDHFLEEAEPFWSNRVDGRLRSGVWRETDSEGALFDLEASAVFSEGRSFLLVERLGTDFEEKRSLLQRGRELRLAHHRLAQAEAKLKKMYGRLEKSHGDLLAVLEQLDLGIVLVDHDGTITFLNGRAQAVFGMQAAGTVGEKWEGVLRLRGADRKNVQDLFAMCPERRKRLPVRFESSRKRVYWMELDVRDDPRDPAKKMLFFYDVSDLYDLRRMLDKRAHFHDLIGKSMAMSQIYEQIQEIARVESTVLIEGETGTGKELVARAIHFSGPRKEKPFVAVNCAGLSESLLASQLFGHRRGAFTGAVADQQGVFEAAVAGTLFLDEIGDVPLSTQTSMLRVLQEKEITRVGESKPRRVDVRVITATQRDLSEEVAKGGFRADLLYRIRVARIRLPRLRDRREDIPLLVEAFLGQNRSATGKSVEEISQEAMRALMDYDWPGNVRELKSAIESAAIRCKGSVIRVEDLPRELVESPCQPSAATFRNGEVEKQRILDALVRAKGNRTQAAHLLGISRATLYRRLFDLGVAPARKAPPE
jgi:PAS domain S-box-containing protein